MANLMVKTFATPLLEDGTDMSTIQESRGHSNLNTAMFYPPRQIRQMEARRAQSG
jgi:site-specific recombinase XerD